MDFHSSRRRGEDGIAMVIDFLLSNARLVLGVGGAAVLGIATLAVKRVSVALCHFVYLMFTWDSVHYLLFLVCLTYCGCLCLADRACRPCRWGRKGGAEDGWELGGAEFSLCFTHTNQKGLRRCGDETCSEGSQTAERYYIPVTEHIHSHTQNYTYTLIMILPDWFEHTWHLCKPLSQSADLCQQPQVSGVTGGPEVQSKPESKPKRIQLCVLTLQVNCNSPPLCS